MHTIFSKKYKKGMWELKQVIILGFAAFLVLVTFSFFNELQAAIVTEPDDGSKANFNRLYSTIKELVESKESTDYRVINYFIGDGKFLVGFDTDWDDTETIIDYTFSTDNIYRSSKCGTSACLCLYSDDEDWDILNKRDTEVISCRSDGLADKDVVFYSEGDPTITFYSEKSANAKLRQMVRSIAVQRPLEEGKYLVFKGENFGTQQIYIEKEIKDSKIYFYISAIDTNNYNDPANKRKLAIEALR